MAEENTRMVKLTSEEKEIIGLIRELQYGELVVSVKNGSPIRAEIKQSVMLGGSGK